MDPAAFQTHEVFNQPPPLAGHDLFEADAALREDVAREGAGWAADELHVLGKRCGDPETIELGFLANANPPELKPFDRFGHRRDEVVFHPAWHALLDILFEHGVHSGPWAEPKAGAHVSRAAKFMLMAQVECGSLCPTTMTYGSVPALRRDPEIAETWLPRIFSRHYDRRFAPIGEKTGAMIGMGLTEKQGGSDVRANTTRAEPIAGTAREYRLIGHKWFLSAPMCDGFLVTAQAPGGITCFFLPRFTPDGALNALRLQRLKDKLGNKSNASSEVEFAGAWALRLGEEGRGIPTIIEMANYTRLDCSLGTTGIMRQAVSQAVHHAAHRSVFQKHLVDQPLMRAVLADLALEVEAAIALCLRMARACDNQADENEGTLLRLLTPAAKYWICKRGPILAGEAMEVLGGGGYVEESIMPRIYREMPVNSIWEGSGNVMCLDVLRSLMKSPQSRDVLLAELRPSRGADMRLDASIVAIETALSGKTPPNESDARRLTEKLVLTLQAALLVRHAPHAVADAFCASRLAEDRSGVFGAVPSGLDLEPIIARAHPRPV
ncbi:MAG TPA: isovaleryl-CoA dehydrogenase [Magnetospirillaceae bacterium]|jgi:putative acyl-CoA dehydrogenase